MTKVMEASLAHEQFYQDVVKTLKQHENMPTIVHIALLSNIIGKLMAGLDQRKYTGPAVLGMIGKNIEQGNAHFIKATLGKTEGNA